MNSVDTLKNEIEELKKTFEQYLLLFKNNNDNRINSGILQDLNYRIYNKEQLLASINRTIRNKQIFGN